MYSSCLHKINVWKGAFLLLIYGTSASLHAQIGPWKSFTKTLSIKEIVVENGTIWGATTGGIISFDPATEEFNTLTNTDGLSSNKTTSIARNSSGGLWFGLSDGTIHTIQAKEPDKISSIIDYRGFSSINDFSVNGDTVYIALDSGIGEYRVDRAESKELYRQLGLDIEKDVKVNQVLTIDRRLCAATNDGVAIASLDSPNLKAPQSWINYGTGHGLPAKEIIALANYQQQLVAASSNGVAIQNDHQWKDITGILSGKTINSIQVGMTGNGTSLFAATAQGIYETTDLQNWSLLRGINKVNNLAIHNGAVWAAVDGLGLALYRKDEARWGTYVPNSPWTNKYSGVAFDSRGTLYCTASGSRETGGILSFDGTTWNNYEEYAEITRGDFRSLAIDDVGRIWFGTWGAGILRLTPSDDNPRFEVINAHDSTGARVAGIFTNRFFAVVNDLFKDRRGNIWMTNYAALNGQSIAVSTPDDQWAYFSPTVGATNGRGLRITVDIFDRIWYGTENDGLQVIDYGGTLLEPSDDIYFDSIGANEEIIAPRITGLADDVDGVAWIGTNEGLNFWLSNEISQQSGLINNDIRVVRVDPSNNKWVGTSGGISFIGSDDFLLTHYTTDSSPLVSNSIVDFGFNAETGDVAIATTDGLSIVATSFTKSRDDFSLLKGYPNPFLLNGERSFTITNLVRQSGLKIYSEDGRLVRQFLPEETSGAKISWDGSDNNGEQVASGIYIYAAYTDNGISATGKVAVVRQR